MANVIVSVMLIALVGWACHSIYKSKKNGAKCIGCPHAGCCGGGCSETSKPN